jgi:hypothetical protein
MKSKKKNSKVPKSAKTRLSDLAAKKDARGGKVAPYPDGGPTRSSLTARSKRFPTV